MNKVAPYFVSAFIAIFACIPAIKWGLPIPRVYWPWMVIFSGFLASLTIFIKTNNFVRVFAIGIFGLCFFSNPPYLAFTTYFSVILCCYFYIICQHVRNWRPVFKTIQALIVLNIVFGAMQLWGHDPLLNFGRGLEHYGTVGHHMQMGSAAVILGAFALNVSGFYLIFVVAAGFATGSTWAVACAGVGAFFSLLGFSKKIAVTVAVIVLLAFTIYAEDRGKFKENLGDNGRLGIWKKTISVTNMKPWTGWGPGSFKYVFPALDSRDDQTHDWSSAHNCPLQAAFELGWPALIVIITSLAWIGSKLYAYGLFRELAGFLMIFVNSLVHFPSRRIQLVLIMIAFLAYCEFKIKEREVYHGGQ